MSLTERGLSPQNRSRIMTGLRFLLKVTMRRHDLSAEIYHIKEPQKIPHIMSAEEVKRLLAMAGNIQVRTLLSTGYGSGMRVGEVVKLNVKPIDSSLDIIRVAEPLWAERVVTGEVSLLKKGSLASSANWEASHR